MCSRAFLRLALRAKETPNSDCVSLGTVHFCYFETPDTVIEETSFSLSRVTTKNIQSALRVAYDNRIERSADPNGPLYRKLLRHASYLARGFTGF